MTFLIGKVYRLEKEQLSIQLSSISRIIMQVSTKISEFLPRNVIGLAEFIEQTRIEKVKRSKNARSDGLSEVATAKAVGEVAGNLYLWQIDPKAYSSLPNIQREIGGVVRSNRKYISLDERTKGKLKIHAKLLDQGFDVSVSTVGRIISDFIEQGVFQDYVFSSRARSNVAERITPPLCYSLTEGAYSERSRLYPSIGYRSR